MVDAGATAKRPLVLVVDDDEATRLVVRAHLESAGFALEESRNGREGVAAFERLLPALTLMDVVMPEMDGFAACSAIRALPEGKRAPILMMTGLDDAESVRKAYACGATDFATKPINGVILCSRIDYILRSSRASDSLYRSEMKNRALLEMLQTKNRELKRLNLALREQANRDGLTGLFNHRFFQEALGREASRSLRSRCPFSLILLDVDWFKDYNDRHGHQRGDAALRALGEILERRVRKSDVVARYGGEEFVILLPETNSRDAMRIAESLRESVETHAFPGGETQPLGSVTASFGVSGFPEDGETPAALIREADAALYRAKHEGRNAVRLARPSGPRGLHAESGRSSP